MKPQELNSGAKEINPKDALGMKRIPLGLVPDSAVIEMSMAFLEGGLKYGRYNWRASEIRASIYHDAMRRHLAKWWGGENEDCTTRVKHLASIMASAAILIDAELFGTLSDDRPPTLNLDGLMADRANDLMPRLVELFKDFKPHQWSIEDDDRLVRVANPR